MPNVCLTIRRPIFEYIALIFQFAVVAAAAADDQRIVHTNVGLLVSFRLHRKQLRDIVVILLVRMLVKQ